MSEPKAEPSELMENATEDAFLGGALSILQPKGGYRAGLDAVLLAATISNDVRSVLDVGAGVGVVGLAVARRVPGATVTMIERYRGLADLARANAARNQLSDRVQVIQADIVRLPTDAAEIRGAAETFDCVLGNPPFHVEGRGTAASDRAKAGSHAMPEGDLGRWARFMARMARPGGTATLIHRADALATILSALASRFGGALVLPIYPRPGEPASRVLVQATKGSRAPLQLLPGLVLHNDDHSFRPDVDAILRHGAALDLLKRPARP